MMLMSMSILIIDDDDDDDDDDDAKQLNCFKEEKCMKWEVTFE